LLGPREFEAWWRSPAKALNLLIPAARAQSMRMMTFYERFGAGAVVETLQRLGAGQSIDQALQTTTELTQAEFFAAWRSWEAGG